eukprot:TRINITY_DN499_c0_g1_i2.p1 TRINITY_DN499_c0_g1~~TRINITY_DN499_c0_g1_i2.p1  ORF type:complete len:311 (-),score=72.38 TRINITY_DN499_c0_g1_i2:869-1801(-)
MMMNRTIFFHGSFQKPLFHRGFASATRLARSPDAPEETKPSGSRSVIETILGMFTKDEEPRKEQKPQKIDLQTIFEPTEEEGEENIEDFLPSDGKEGTDSRAPNGYHSSQIYLEELKYVHLYPRLVRQWVLDAKTPKGYYDIEGFWKENELMFDDLELDEPSALYRKLAPTDSVKTNFMEYENLAPDLKGNYRFDIRPEEMEGQSAKIKELLSLQNATAREINRFRRRTAVETFGKTPQDTGSAGVQVAIMTHKVRSLENHCKNNHMDKKSHRSLHLLVAKRRQMMRYLKRHDPPSYWKVLKELNLRDVV